MYKVCVCVNHYDTTTTTAITIIYELQHSFIPVRMSGNLVSKGMHFVADQLPTDHQQQQQVGYFTTTNVNK